ncbi:MAG TPA: NAD+ synthase [Acidimicrobiia bacterium]|nr:NAD+ synthase [Acidimicrobiia bacterium]
MPIRVAGAQINLVVGDIVGNERRIGEAMEWAEQENADVLLLPELAVTGYPPEDLVLRSSFIESGIDAVRRLARRSGTVTTVVGFVDHGSPAAPGDLDAGHRRVANAVAVLEDGRLVGTYHKVLLPNYGVFDEDRYFVAGSDPDRIWEVGGVPVGVSICEDIWLPDGPPRRQAQAGARVLLNVNASPFHRGKAGEREDMLASRARASGVPVVYLNLVGGQDELVFDGASVVVAADGTVIHRSPQFAEDRFVVDVPFAGEHVRVDRDSLAPLLDPIPEIYAAVTTGLGDYVRKNGFDSVLVSLSGGIDSAMVATLAVDALGPEKVWGVSLPSRYSSQGSIDDARSLAENLGIRFDIIPMDDVFQAYLDTLSRLFAGTESDSAEENLQARVRGVIVMALSNKFGPLVLATGNKSEMAVGYSTIYGDMVGGFAPIKDVFKTLLYRLAEWRNSQGKAIPQDTIDKPPSAELRPDQTDQDTLPPYSLLDQILDAYIEDDLGVDEIIADGFDPEVVHRVLQMVDRSEYKRRQAAPGVKITVKAFGKDRRLPITNRFREPS